MKEKNHSQIKHTLIYKANKFMMTKENSRKSSILSIIINTGRSLHCKVEQPRANTCKKMYIKHHQKDQFFINLFFMSRYVGYLLHSKMVPKFDNMFYFLHTVSNQIDTKLS